MNQPIYYTLGLIFIFLSGLTYSQGVLKGTVTDAETAKPLIGARIIIVGTTTGALTADDGSYTLSLPAESEAILVSYFGYQEQRINIDGNQCNLSSRLSGGGCAQLSV